MGIVLDLPKDLPDFEESDEEKELDEDEEVVDLCDGQEHEEVGGPR